MNSSCADPVNPRTNTHLVERECDNGVCLKWTKYDKGEDPHFGTERNNACPFVERMRVPGLVG